MTAQKVYTKKFWMLCLSAFLFITSFNVLVPELPDMVNHFGGSFERGFPIVFFAFAALISRPISGKLVDEIGRIPVIMIGTIICVVLGLVYQFADGLYVFLFFRFVHGFSTGFTPVGNMSYLADITPQHRRGEAMGTIGMAASLGFPAGMLIGSSIAANYGWSELFYTSSGIALLSLILVSTYKETLPNPKKFTLSLLKIQKGDLFDKGIFIPFIVMFLTIFSFGTLLIIGYDQALALGFSIEEKSIFFLVYALVSIVFRYPSGVMSDRFGRRNVMIVGSFFLIASLITLVFTENQTNFLIAAGLFGVASGLNSPTIFAWATDLASKNRIGHAISTLFIAIESGIILGALLAGLFTGDNHENFRPVHLSSLGMACLSLLILLMTKRDVPPKAIEETA